MARSFESQKFIPFSSTSISKPTGQYSLLQIDCTGDYLVQSNNYLCHLRAFRRVLYCYRSPLDNTRTKVVADVADASGLNFDVFILYLLYESAHIY